MGPQRRFVIGISAPSGGGKTTVARHLMARLPDAVLLCFDDYDHLTSHPASYAQWLAAGADYNAWQTPQLNTDLRRLRQGEAIVHPLTGEVVPAATTIVFDAPLGRAHDETGGQIDLMVFLDTPLDVAMARRLLRDSNQNEAPFAEIWARLRSELTSYLTFGRAAYLEMDRQVKPGCDLILDGLRPPDELAQQILMQILETNQRS
jgi:uridine kinase